MQGSSTFVSLNSGLENNKEEVSPFGGTAGRGVPIGTILIGTCTPETV